MDDILPPSPSSPTPPPPPPATEPHAGGRRVKRRLMLALIGLWGVSIIAAVIVILKPAAPEKGKDGAPGQSGILSLAQKESVGWIPIHGPIFASESGRPWDKGVEQWGRKIRAMAETQGVKALVLDINSPGGSVGAVQELHSTILRVRKEKNIPVVALFGDIAASGGYYIAAACDKIVAHPGTLTGSIGVIFSVSNMEGLFQKIGYKTDPIKSGPHKDIGSPARPMTKEERALLQGLIDDAYGQFLSAVAVGRNLPETHVKEWADGRIFSGRQALDMKAVDMLGDSTDALELAGKLAGIQGKPKVRRNVDSAGWISELFETYFSGKDLAASLLSRLPKTQAGLQYLWPGW